MKVVALIVVAVVFAQAAEIPKLRNFRNLPPRSVLFPRPSHAQGPGYFTPTGKHAHTFSTRGICGQVKYPQSERIVGGEEAIPHEFPWQVALVVDNSWFCGATIIASDWILTAAHCTDGGSSFEVILGAHNKNIVEPTQVRIMATEYTMHPRWNSARLQNDVALIRLPTPVSFTAEIAPICLVPNTEEDHVGDMLLASGWGLDSDTATTTTANLRKVQAPGISVADCQAVYGNSVQDSVLCIDTTGGHGTCNGDSGGPLSYINNGVYNQVGLVSFGSASGCELGYPTGFSRISSFIDWIVSVTGIVV
ncbi:chymotrypsin-like protein [Daphnia sinensis]|uniref:Chymotrypsin-like protein n=1 Tax=Daphnia sinensis TaxID=1820382 RepID=A0AAD5KRL7_9CRUS|nr:chymotrypsin-like protein [Daphnia sinensis]